MLATNFGSICPEVTNFGSQNFGYQIRFCATLLNRGSENSKCVYYIPFITGGTVVCPTIWVNKSQHPEDGGLPHATLGDSWAYKKYHEGMFTHAQSRRRGKRVENCLQHKSLHVFTHMQSRS